MDIGFGPGATTRPAETTALILFWLASAFGTSAYNVAFEWIAGTTIGKLFVGAQVVDLDLGTIRLSQAIRRSIGFVVDALFFGMVAAIAMSESPLKQRVGDKWAKTRVVRRSALLPKSPSRLRVIVYACLIAVSFSATSTLIMEYLRRHG